MTSRKWRLVRVFETIIRLLQRLTPPRIPLEDPNQPPANILVVEYWNLGDLAILVPFLANLRRSFPRTTISLLVRPELAHFLDGQGLVDEFITIRAPWGRHFSRWRKYNPFCPDWISLLHTIVALRKRGFDWAFSGRMDLRDNLLLWLSGARRRIGYGMGGGGFLLTDDVWPDVSRPHRADVWLHLLQAVNVLPNRKLGDLRLRNEEHGRAQSFLRARGIPVDAFLIGFHPGARSATRRWGHERFAEVARRVLEQSEAHVLWFVEPGTSCQAPQMERCHVVSLDFRSLLAVLSYCRLLVCNDSGPMHLANLLRVPVVAVFGPQRPESFGPRGPYDRVVIRPEFSCRPCLDYCIFDQPYCLRTISTKEVYSAVVSVLGSAYHGERDKVGAR